MTTTICIDVFISFVNFLDEFIHVWSDEQLEFFIECTVPRDLWNKNDFFVRSFRRKMQMRIAEGRLTMQNLDTASISYKNSIFIRH